jgi:acyl-CoA thioesterase-1
MAAYCMEDIMKFCDLLSKKNSDLYGTKQVTAAFLGDSVTQGCFEVFKVGETGLDTVYDYENVYHNKFKKMLNQFFPIVPINIINAGLSGGSATNGMERLERDVLRYSPDLVVVCFGLNDVHGGTDRLSDYTNALISIFTKLKQENIETIFLTPNMMNTNVSPHIMDDFIRGVAGNFAKIQNEGMMDLYISSAKEVCKNEGIPICDCYSKWKKLYASGVNVTELLSNNLNHPTRDMHSLFASELLNLIVFTE